MNAVFLVPWRESKSHNRDLLSKVILHLSSYQPRIPVVVCDNEGAFQRGEALNDGVDCARDAGYTTVVFCDADCLIDFTALTFALELSTLHRLVIPFTHYAPLTKRGTDRVLEGASHWTADQTESSCWSTGGAGVISIRAFERVHGFDGRFQGWGFEDAAFAIACDSILGRSLRVVGRLTHLYHSWTPRGGPEYDAGLALAQRYEQVWGDEAACRALIAEYPW